MVASLSMSDPETQKPCVSRHLPWPVSVPCQTRRISHSFGKPTATKALVSVVYFTEDLGMQTDEVVYVTVYQPFT